MNNIQIFSDNRFGDIRTVMIGNEPFFVATDVCRVLEIANTTQAMQRLDEDEKSMLNIGLPGGATNCVNEYGLYNLVLASRKPEAKAFKRWITHEVIPQIRKTGGYHLPHNFKEALQMLITSEEEKEKLLEDNKRMKPKEVFADAVSVSDTPILVGELAKLIRQNGVKIGQNRLFEILREKGVLIKSGTAKNMPTQRAMDLGIMGIKERTIQNPDGTVRITKTPVVTGKGQIYFINKFLTK